MNGRAVSTPSPRALDSQEWIGIAETASELRGRERVARGQAAVRRQLSRLSTLFSQMECPASPAIPASPSEPVKSFSALGDELLVRLTSRDGIPGRKSCTLLSLQQNLINYALQISTTLAALEAKYETGADADTFTSFVTEAANIHSMLLSATIEAAGGVVESSQLHSMHLSEEASVYLGYLVSFAKRMVRQVVSPPMVLQRPWSPRNSELMRAGGLTEPPSDSRAPLSAQLTSGDTLYDVIARDEARFNPVHRGSEIAQWESLLPAPLIPAHIDIVIFIVKLQDEYDCVGMYVITAS